jgi:hypothetical protein
VALARVAAFEKKQAAAREVAAGIKAATALAPPRSPQAHGEMLHSALPMHRPTGGDWAFQTLYVPRTLTKWKAGNVFPPPASGAPTWPNF